ncbi:MAG TPA: hypothetical protein VF331_04340, partial [Polyangiales bacterium]
LSPEEISALLRSLDEVQDLQGHWPPGERADSAGFGEVRRNDHDIAICCAAVCQDVESLDLRAAALPVWLVKMATRCRRSRSARRGTGICARPQSPPAMIGGYDRHRMRMLDKNARHYEDVRDGEIGE